MAFFEAVPLRARENFIVQRVECREMLLRKLSRRLILFEVGRLIRRLCGQNEKHWINLIGHCLWHLQAIVSGKCGTFYYVFL